MFELPITGVLQPVPDASSPPIQRIQQTYSVTVTFKQRPRMYVTTVIVRGSVNNAKAVKQATALLMEHLTGNMGAALPVSIQLEIAPQHHLFMIGRGGANMKQIMQRTGASIHFPDPSNVTPQRKGTVYITGNIESVYLARQQVIGCLPLVLMFDMKEDTEIDQVRISQLMEHLDVFVSVKPKPKQPSKSVIVKSIERNAANMYEARRQLLGLGGELPLPIMTTSSQDTNSTNSLGLAGLGLLGHNMLNINTSSLFMLNGGTKSPGPCPQSPGKSSPSVISSPPGIYAPMMLVTPATSYAAVQSAYASLYAQNGLSKDLNHNSALIRIPTPSDRAASSNNSSTNSPSGSPVCTSPIDLINKTSNTNSPTLSDIEVHTMKSGNGYVDVVIPKKPSPANSLHSADLMGMASPASALNNPGSPLEGTGSPLQNPGSPLNKCKLTVMLEDNVRNIPFQNGERSSESGCESDGSDHRAPGSNRPSPPVTSSIFGSTTPFAFDYEQKKLLATKAMQKKPIGEPRNPTDFWSGLGFSKSMPDSAIRERLKQSGGKYTGPSMTTTYENVVNGDIDRDPWKDSKRNPGSNALGVSVTPGSPLSASPHDYLSSKKDDVDFGLSSSNHMDGGSLPKSSWPIPHKADLAELFSKLGLGKYTDLFQQQEIDLSTFLTLTDQDLKELGISTFGARRKMLLAIADLSKRQTIFSSAPGSNNPFRNNGANSSNFISRRHDIVSQSGRW